MSCSCILSVDHDSGPDCFRETNPIARKSHRCCECDREIAPGEKYERVDGIWEGYPRSYKTCIDCASVRNSLFCSYIYTEMWEALGESFNSCPELPSSKCMSELTTAARDKVCDLLEEYWGDDGDVYRDDGESEEE